MELLKQLYSIYSPSYGEKKFRKYLRKWINANIENVTTESKDGNLYVIKGDSETYPCVVAHLDQVQHNHSKDFEVLDCGDVLMGYSPSNRQQQGLGADDKNGVWIALQCLQRFDVMKVAFFMGEEVGCVGSSKADMRFFDDCRFVLQCDRRNNSDLITDVWGEMCSREFLNDTDYALYGYNVTHGLMTDVATLKDNGLKVSCVNMSCGYYAPHTDEEFTSKEDLLKCLCFVEHIIENCTKVYPHELAPKTKYSNDWSWLGNGTTKKQSNYYIADDLDDYYSYYDWETADEKDDDKSDDMFDYEHAYDLECAWEDMGDYLRKDKYISEAVLAEYVHFAYPTLTDEEIKEMYHELKETCR